MVLTLEVSALAVSCLEHWFFQATGSHHTVFESMNQNAHHEAAHDEVEHENGIEHDCYLVASNGTLNTNFLLSVLSDEALSVNSAVMPILQVANFAHDLVLLLKNLDQTSPERPPRLV